MNKYKLLISFILIFAFILHPLSNTVYALGSNNEAEYVMTFAPNENVNSSVEDNIIVPLANQPEKGDSIPVKVAKWIAGNLIWDGMKWVADNKLKAALTAGQIASLIGLTATVITYGIMVVLLQINNSGNIYAYGTNGCVWSESGRIEYCPRNASLLI